MPLTTKDDMILRFGEKMLIEITDRENPRTGEINDTVLDDAIAKATAFMLSFLRERYDVEALEADPPDPIPTIAEDFTLWYLSNSPLAWVKEKYEVDLTWLNLARKGDVTLGLDSSGEAPEMNSKIQYDAAGRTFDDTRLAYSFMRQPLARRNQG